MSKSDNEVRAAEDWKIDLIDVDGRKKAIIQFHRYPIYWRNWLQTIDIPREGVHYKIITNSIEQAPENYLYAPYQYAYSADVEVVDGDITLGPTEITNEEQEATRIREILSAVGEF